MNTDKLFVEFVTEIAAGHCRDRYELGAMHAKVLIKHGGVKEAERVWQTKEDHTNLDDYDRGFYETLLRARAA